MRTEINTTMKDPEGPLEEAFIREFVEQSGFEVDALRGRTDAETHRILTAACLFASSKLAEIDARSHTVRDWKGGRS